MAKIKTRFSAGHNTKPKNINNKAFEKVYRPYLPLLLIASLLLSIAVRTGNMRAYVQHPSGRVLSYATAMSINGLLEDTNIARSSNGVSSLSLNARLDSAAQAKADDMATRNYWSHNTPEGNPPWVFVANQEYSYQKLGENLATGFSDEQATINGWMASPPHRENLLDPSFKEVGFGYSNNPNYTAAGGGPMTIIVAYYGEPQVLSASTTVPAATKPTTTSPAQQVPVNTSPAPQSQATIGQSPSAVADTTNTRQANNQPRAKSSPTNTANGSYSPSVKSSRIQLVIGNTKVTSAISIASVILAILLFACWARKHALALHRFLLKGENYALSHPLTEISLIVLAALLFILSQTAGLVQ